MSNEPRADRTVRVELGNAERDGPVGRSRWGVGAAVLVALLVVLVAYAARPPRSIEPAPPTVSELRQVLESIGGLEATTLAVAHGAFDVVTFDPVDPDRLLATYRDGYGPAENQAHNQLWELEPVLSQRPWNADRPHDFAHFNDDGTISIWEHGGGDGFAPRKLVVLDRAGATLSELEPIYASRAVVSDATLFALTGSPDFYSNEASYRELVALRPDGVTRLADGAGFDWLTVTPGGELVAFPVSGAGATAVWDIESLRPLEDHALAGRSYRRAAVSGGGEVAVGIRFDGRMEELDLSTGAVRSRFGSVDPAPIDTPIGVDDHGHVAVTVSSGGEVAIWVVGSDEPVDRVRADVALPRWLPDHRASRSASVISPDASRVALRIGARPGQDTEYRIVETDPAAWLARV